MMCIWLVKQHFVVTLIIPQTEIPVLLDSWVKNAPSVKMFTQNNCISLYFHKNTICLHVGL
jgi:hypothetical protein